MNPLRQLFMLFTVKFDDKELKRGEKSVKRFKDNLRTVGTRLAGFFGARAIVKGFNETTDRLDGLAKMARGVGTTVESLQDLEFALDRLGGDPGSVRNMVVSLNKALGEAQTGSKEYVDSFKQIGIEFQELDGLDPVDQFAIIRDAMEEAAGSAQSIAGASIVLGRGFKSNLPVFKATASEWRDLIRERGALGGFTQAQADLGEKLADVRRNFQQVTDSLKGVAFEAAAPKAIEYIELLTEMIQDEQALGTANDTLAQSFTVLGGVIASALGPVAFLFFSMANLLATVKANADDLVRSFSFLFEKLENIPGVGSLFKGLRAANAAGLAQERAEFGSPGSRGAGLLGFRAPSSLALGRGGAAPVNSVAPGDVPAGLARPVDQTVIINAQGLNAEQVAAEVAKQGRAAARADRSRSE